MKFSHLNCETKVREEFLSDLNIQQYNYWIKKDRKINKPSN